MSNRSPLRRPMRTMLAIAIAASTSVVVPLAAPSAHAATSVSGTVTNEADDGLLALVNFCNDALGCEFTFTDANGDYAIALGDAVWTAEFTELSGGGYQPEFWNGAYREEDATPIDTTAGGAFTVDIVLQPLAVAHGTLTLPGGAPVASTNIRFCPTDTTQSCTFTLTEADGTFSTPLTADTYTIRFFGGSSAHHPLYWDGRISEALADPAMIVPATTPTFDGELQALPTISGTVRNQFGETVPDTRVGLCNVALTFCRNVTTGADGTYLQIVPPDVYTAEFRSLDQSHLLEFWQDQPAIDTATPIDVSDGADAQIDPTVQKKSSFSGTVTDAVGGSVEDLPVVACRVSVNACFYGQIEADGTYTLPVDDDTFTLRFGGSDFGGPNPSHRQEWFDDELIGAAGQQITMANGETFIADAVLATAIELSGTVTDDDGGAPLEGVGVTACDLASVCESATTAADGTYTLDAFGENSYLVDFDGSSLGYNSEFYDDSADEAGALRVVTTSGVDATGVDAGLTGSATIGGTVTEIGVGPVEGVQVNVCESAYDLACPWFPTASDGTWSATVSAGTYYVRFEAGFLNLGSKYYDDTYNPNEAAAITVDFGDDVTGTDAQLERVGIVRGTVINDQLDPLEGIEVRVCPLPVAFPCLTATTLADGQWASITDPGPTYVSFSDPTGVYPTITYDQRYQGFNAVEVTPNGIFSNIDALMSRPGFVSGRVTNSLGEGIENVEVTISGSAFFGNFFTAADGTYLLETNVGTDRRLDFEHPDYVAGEISNVDVFAATETTGQDIVLIGSGKISGVVTDAAGTPLPGINVFSCVFTCVGNATTDANGVYLLNSVPESDDGDRSVGAFDLSGTFARVYYEDAIDADSATPVAVAAGQTTTGIDLVMRAASSVSGSVQLPNGTPAETVQVELCLVDGGGCLFASTDASGDYEVTGVSPGTYRVRFDPAPPHAPTYYGDVVLIAEASELSVGAGSTTTGIDATLVLGGSISGRVTDASGGGLFFTQVYPNACSASTGQCLAGPLFDGDYEIEGLAPADDYVVRFLNETSWITEWYCDANSADDAVPVTVASGGTTLGIDASMQRDGDPDHDTCDQDGDTVLDPIDNCVAESNVQQSDLNGDGEGDACDNDDDGDNVPDTVDNCPVDANGLQEDLDGDGDGDACDPSDDRVVFDTFTPSRFADSRNQPTFDGLFRSTGPRQGGTVWEIQIAGRGDVPDDADAAVLNVTVLGAVGPGFATVHPCGDVPNASSVNYAPGQVEPNELIAKLSPDGAVCVFTKTTAHVIVDVVGAATDSPLTTSAPSRFADSRDQPTVDGLFRDTGPRPAGSVWEIDIAGRGEVPSDATTAVVNLTVTGGTGPGFATVYPCGDVPNASSLNYDVGITRPNELITKLSPTGTICVYTLTDVQVIVDVGGHLTDGPGYTALTPARYADSRNQPTIDGLFRNTGPRQGSTTWEIDITGRGDVPDGATTVVANLTITGGAGPGFATVHACGTLPTASSLNYGPGITRSNELITKLSATGTICVYMLADAHVIVDIVGHT